MDNKNLVYTKVIFLIVGIFAGWLVFGSNLVSRETTHVMPNGQRMNNDGSMESVMHQMNSSLEGKTGEEFNEAFIDEMIVHHKGAVEMAQLVLINSKRPELIQLANDIISAQNKEIDMMENWKATWFK